MQFYQLHEIVLRMCIDPCKASFEDVKRTLPVCPLLWGSTWGVSFQWVGTWIVILCQTIENKGWDIDILI